MENMRLLENATIDMSVDDVFMVFFCLGGCVIANRRISILMEMIY